MGIYTDIYTNIYVSTLTRLPNSVVSRHLRQRQQKCQNCASSGAR